MKFAQHFKQNAVGYVSLLFSTCGLATAASYVITNQNQVAPNTINSSAIVDGTVAPVDLAPTEAWHRVTYATYNCGSGVTCEYRDALGGVSEYYKDAYGAVHVRLSTCYSSRFLFQAAGSGNCTQNGDGNGHPVFRLPAGYRPAFNINLYGDNNTVYQVGSGGSVSLVDGYGYSATDPTEFSFRADN